jgi:LysW-gamma-L-lysine/LysW-L-ornithine aminotransferase
VNIREVEDQHEVDVYPRRDVVLVRGYGSKLYDEHGKEYIDCASNIGVSLIGHGNPIIAQTLQDQYLKLANCYSMFYNDTRAKLVEKLVSIAPPGLSRVFLCNSGTEAVEAALKFARSTTGKNRTGIVCAIRGFHGKTMGSLAATWDPKYHEPFLPMLQGFTHIPFNNIEKLREAVMENTSAVLLEVVQGEGGVRVGDKQFFQEARRLCTEKGVLLIIDEVQTGFGRTGTLWACEQYVTPDILCCAKAIAGGVPMGAVLCSDKIQVPKRSHTSTFGGNPLACAAALASIDIIQREHLPSRAATLGAYLQKNLKKINSPRIKEIRGLGLMIGIELQEKADPYVKILMDKGIIVLMAGPNVIRLLPPLVITKEEIDTVIHALNEVLC